MTPDHKDGDKKTEEKVELKAKLRRDGDRGLHLRVQKRQHQQRQHEPRAWLRSCQVKDEDSLWALTFTRSCELGCMILKAEAD